MSGEECTWIVPPNVVGALCGAKYACFLSGNRVRITYLDDTTEEAYIPENQRQGWGKSFFAIVSAVQSKRQS